MVQRCPCGAEVNLVVGGENIQNAWYADFCPEFGLYQIHISRFAGKRGWHRPDKLSQLLVTIRSSRKEHDMQLSPSLSSQLVRDLGAAIVGQAGRHKPLNSPPH